LKVAAVFNSTVITDDSFCMNVQVSHVAKSNSPFSHPNDGYCSHCINPDALGRSTGPVNKCI